MKRYSLTAPLALLSVAFLLGCQEQGSEPVGPDGLGPEFAPGGGGGKGGGGKKGGAVLANVTMTNGWTGTADSVSFKDGTKLIEFEYQGDGERLWDANMTNTHATGIAAGILNYCVQGGAGKGTDDELDDLFDQLVLGNTARPGAFFVRVDKTVLSGSPPSGSSEDHMAQFTWPNETGTSLRLNHFILRVGTFATATVDGDFGDTDNPLTVVFTEGSVRLTAIVSKPAKNFWLTCPVHADEVITMVLTPSS